MGRVPTDCRTSQEWGVWLVDQHLPGGRKGPLLPAAQPPRPAARDALPLVLCRLLGKLDLLLLCDSRGQTLGPGPALAAGDGGHTISV